MPKQNLTLSSKASRAEAVMIARRLLASYPATTIHDPEVYIAEIVSILIGYPRAVGEAAIKHAGLESPKYLPSAPEIAVACQHVTAPTVIDRMSSWELRSQWQLAERAEIDAKRNAETPEQRRAVVEKIRRDMAAAGMPIMGDQKRAYRETPETVKARLGISDAQWDAIPDAPNGWQHGRARSETGPT